MSVDPVDRRNSPAPAQKADSAAAPKPAAQEKPQANAVKGDGFAPAPAKAGGNPLADGWKKIQDVVARLKEIATTTKAEPLSDPQKAELNKVFGSSLDVNKVTVVKGPPELFDNLPRETPAFTVGNTIIVNPKYYPPSNDLVVHEATHAWQFQHGGGEYLPQALAAQWFGEGYDWQKGVGEGKPWEELNPEQQAEMIQEAYQNGAFDDPNKRFVMNGTDYTDYLRKAEGEVHAGRGAAKTWDISNLWPTIHSKIDDLRKRLGF